MGKGKSSNSLEIFDDPMIKDGSELGHDGHVHCHVSLLEGNPDLGLVTAYNPK